MNWETADATMDGCLELTRNSNDQQSVGTSGNVLRQPRSSINLQDQPSRKPSLSYADLHHEITRNVREIPASSVGNRQKQQIDRKTTKEDELVKYMSKLPSYLEKGKNPQEKVLNVGVLDWGRLEKWQYSHKQMPYRSSRYSPSSSNTTSCFSTDGSSTHSSRGHSCSPGPPTMHRPSLQSHFMKSPTEGHSEVVEKLQDLRVDQSSTSNGPERFMGTDKSLFKNRLDIKVEHCMGKDSDPKNELENRSLRNGPYFEMAAPAKVNKKTHDGELKKKAENLQRPYLENLERDIPEGCNKVVLLLPRDFPENNNSGLSHLTDSTTLLHQRAEITARRSFSERPKEACHAELTSDFQHSYHFPSEVESKHSQVKQLGSTDAASFRLQSNTLGSASQSATAGANPARGRYLEEKKVSTSSTASEPYKGLSLKPSKATAEKVRSTSPFRRFSIGVGKMSKVSSSKDSLDIQQPSSTIFSAKPGSDNTVTTTFLDASAGDKSNATGRAKSSPLRRLLDPLLKPKVANCHHLEEPLEKDSTSTSKACKSSWGRVDSLYEQPGKIKLGMTGCKTINVSESSKVKKNGSSTAQALLRVAVKNGLPLFTFAVENDIDVLAATRKKLNTLKKDDCSCIYTFFSIREVKKKSGSWINQGSKSKSHDYIRNVVAQMKVADSQFPNLVRLEEFSVREYVLFSVNLRQADCQTSDFQPKDELAATVVKIPKKSNQKATGDWHHRDSCSNFPTVGSKECLSKVRRHSYSGEAVQSKPFVGGQGHISTTVILPSGIHSLPSDGGPSSLIERWSSGGLCDCGGWDLGCNLQIFENQHQVSEKLTSQKVCAITDRFELFPQGGLQENQTAFSLTPFKDGIYSVEFHSSLSILQAFSVCIAVLDSWNLCEFSEARNSLQEKTLGETISMQNDGLGASNRTEGEVPARYVSYPPLSPVGRV